MKTFPIPALVAAAAAVIAAPFSLAAAGTLLLTAALGTIIHADYVQRGQRVRLPRLPLEARIRNSRAPLRGERHQLAA